MNNNIQKLRKSFGLTMAQLAEKVGTTQQQIDRLEKGKRKLSAEWIDVLCKAFSCKPSELVEFEVEQANRKSAVRIASALVIGAIETKFGNNVREFGDDEKYEIRFKPSAKNQTTSYFGLVVEGGNYLSHPDGTELIFAGEINSLATGLAEDKSAYHATVAQNSLHSFKFGHSKISAQLIKSFRNE